LAKVDRRLPPPDATNWHARAESGLRAHRLDYRPHLDGLRALAVYLVVAFHTGLGGFRGGFVGVDVFFVLSGFFVTSILLRDLAASGRIDGPRFYARRVRRLLPAALVALFVIAIAYAIVATPAEMLDALGGFRAACLYVANWYFIRQSTDYFAANINASPVLHFWSLAVEEQFYLLWPMLLGALYFVARASRWRWWIVRLLVIAAATASALAAWNIGRTTLDRAYFGTDTRAYQLLAGALLALSPQAFRFATRSGRAMRWVGALAVAGIVAVASSAVQVSPITRGFFAAAMTSIAIVALEAPVGGLVKRLLSSAQMTYLGRLSYGIYLWHWPVAVIVLHNHRVGSPALFVLTCVLATALAAISFHLLEQPVRRSHALDRYGRPVLVIAVAASILVGLLVIPTVLDRGGAAVSDARARMIDWRGARTDVEKLPDCLHASIARCTVAHGTKQRVLLMGDSYAQMWMPTFEQIAKDRSLTLVVAAMDACPWQRGLFYLGQGSLYQSCKRHQADWYDRIVPSVDPDIVVLAQAGAGSSQFQLPLTFPDGRKLSSADPGYMQAFEDASAASIDALQPAIRRVVIIEPTPSTYPLNPLSCLSTGRPPSHCVYKVDATPSPLELYYRTLSRNGDIRSLDVDRVVCPRLPVCDAGVGGVITRRDANGHLTASFARSVAGAIDQRLNASGVFGTT